LDKNSKTYWHGAFFEALQLELYEYADFLEFFEERHLSKEALRMDVLVVKKNKAVTIEKNIGRIFKTHNIFEFKSEMDSFSFWDYNKLLGYAFLYSSFEKIPMSDITISISLTMHPREFIKTLESEYGFTLQTADEGIYYVVGGVVSTQILESKKLPKKSNVFFRNLRSNLSVEDMYDTLDSYKERKLWNDKNAYIYRLINANFNTAKEVSEMVEMLRNPAFENVIKELAVERGWLKEHENNIVIGIAKRLLSRGHSVDEVAETTELPIETVMSLR
jgi:hypothetical protein